MTTTSSDLCRFETITSRQRDDSDDDTSTQNRMHSNNRTLGYNGKHAARIARKTIHTHMPPNPNHKSQTHYISMQTTRHPSQPQFKPQHRLRSLCRYRQNIMKDERSMQHTSRNRHRCRPRMRFATDTRRPHPRTQESITTYTQRTYQTLYIHM